MSINLLKLFLFVGLLLCACSPTAFAQTGNKSTSFKSASELGLVLTGERKIGTNLIERADDEIYVSYRVRMTFENKGQEPVIIINPTLGFGTGLKEARFFYRDKTGSSVKAFELSKTKRENFKSMAQYFAEQKPPENMTIVLEPGGTFPFEDQFVVELSLIQEDMPKYRKDFIASLKKDKERRAEALAYYKKWGIDFEGIQLTYEFSFLSDDSDPDLLENMSQRWRRFGRLPVGTNGTYTITSEKIK